MADNFKELDAKEYEKTNGGTSIAIFDCTKKMIQDHMRRLAKKYM